MEFIRATWDVSGSTAYFWLKALLLRLEEFGVRENAGPPVAPEQNAKAPAVGLDPGRAGKDTAIQRVVGRAC